MYAADTELSRATASCNFCIISEMMQKFAYLDSSTALQLGIPFQLDPAVTIPKNLRLPGAATCVLLPHAPFFESGLLVKVVDGLIPEPVPTPLADAEVASGIPATHRWWLSEHGSQHATWRPARNCSRATTDAQWSEIGCNSDGVVWARMLGNGQSFFSNQEARASKIASRSSPQDGLIVAGEFRGSSREWSAVASRPTTCHLISTEAFSTWNIEMLLAYWFLWSSEACEASRVIKFRVAYSGGVHCPALRRRCETAH